MIRKSLQSSPNPFPGQGQQPGKTWGDNTKWLDRVDMAQSLYQDLVKKQIDSISEEAKKKVEDPVSVELDPKSNGFWVAVQYFVEKNNIYDWQFFKKYFMMVILSHLICG